MFLLGISRHVSIQRYGAAINCFTVLAGLLLRGENCEHSIFVLDGDVYNTQEDHKKRLEAVLTGNDEHVKGLRDASLEKIKCFRLPDNTQPEKYIHSIIVNLKVDKNDEYAEIIDVAKQIVVVNNNHKYIDDIITRIDLDRGTGLSKIIDLISLTEQWNSYIADIKEWLSQKVTLVQESEHQET